MANIPAEQQHCRWHGMRVFNAKGCPVCFPEAPSSKQKTYRLGDPEDDLFSDAMDRAISMHHSVMHGARRNAERAGEPMGGEKIARRALAAGIKAYLEEAASGDETPADGHRVRSLEWELRRASYRFNWLADHHLTTDYAKTEARKLADEFWKAQESPEKTSEHAPSCALLIHGRECNCKWIPDTRGSEP
jgi:hypothetical protein